MKAVCVRCGAEKAHYGNVCPSCGNRPDGEGLLVAWIASDANLDEAALAATSRRIAAGEPLRPSAAMLQKARRALGREISTDEGLTVLQRFLLLGCSIVFTPFVGFTCFFWWRTEHPRSAWQALGLSLPPSVFFTAMWVYAVLEGVR